MCTRFSIFDRRTRVWLIGWLIFAALAGCDRSAAMVHVRGKVLNKDGTVPQGGVRIVRFEPVQGAPAEKRRVASGNIENDGSFDLFTKMPGDGVIPGAYNVTFMVWKGEHDRVSLIPDSYTSSSSTPYKNVKVDRDQDDLKFEIEPISAAGAAK
jgi:hypothetical protein